jgi:Tfp pilus assembly protein FimV
MKAIPHRHNNMFESNTANNDPNRLHDWFKNHAGSIALAAVVAGGAVFATHELKNTADPLPSEETVSHTIQPGETLWSIAGDLDPEGKRDVRDIVDQIMALNPEIKAGALDPGTEILIPQE